MTARSNAKPTSTDRYWPMFAAGWDGNLSSPIDCADCGLPAYVGLGARDPQRAEVAHIDPTDQRWTDNVTVTCRACNAAHGATPQPHLSPLPYSIAARDASRAWVRAERQRVGAETARRAAARAARWG